MHDCLIVGGGPAGAAAAQLLARGGWSVAVVEAAEYPRRKVCGEYLSATNWPLLRALGIDQSILSDAGPEVRRVGLVAGRTRLEAPLPPGKSTPRWGRALSREHLDTLLLQRAAERGAEVLQPARCTQMRQRNGVHELTVERAGETLRLEGRVLVAAHGSWNPGQLPTQPVRRPPRSGDLFGFKAHFHGTQLPADLMPLLAFPGGYGGMVHCEAGLASLSCCISRKQLNRIGRRPGTSAGDSVLDYLLQTSPQLREIFAGSKRQGKWLATGPIHPGIRPRFAHHAFRIGNATGEAHPVVAEGISMALQSAGLLSNLLLAREPRDFAVGAAETRRAARAYGRRWSQCFAGRLRAASLIAHWAMRPSAVRAATPILRRWPSLLTWGARLSGKSTQVVHDHSFSQLAGAQ